MDNCTDPITHLIAELEKMVRDGNTISGLARAAGLDQSTLWRIMHGERRPSGDSIIALTRAFPALASVVFMPGDGHTPQGE